MQAKLRIGKVALAEKNLAPSVFAYAAVLPQFNLEVLPNVIPAIRFVHGGLVYGVQKPS